MTGVVESIATALAEIDAVEASGQGAGAITAARQRQLLEDLLVSLDTPTATGTTAARTAQDRFAESINVRDFGALGDNATDDTAAINAALAYARTNQGNGWLRVVVPPGKYVISSPINLTGFGTDGDDIKSIVVDAWGAVIDCRFANSTAGLDMLGTRWVTINGLTIYGNPSYVPRFGLQVGRIANTINSDLHTFNHLRVIGFFAQAGIYNFASESCQWNSLYVLNSTASGAYGMILDCYNHFSVSSTFVTVTATANSAQSMNDNCFLNATFINASSDLPVLWIAGTAGTTFLNCYCLAQAATSGVALWCGTTSASIVALRMGCHFEGASLAQIFLVTGTTSTAVVSGLLFHEYFLTASTYVVKMDTGVPTLILTNMDFEISTMLSGTVVLFDQPAAMWGSGKIWLPNTVPWTVPGIFVGQVIIGSDVAEVPAQVTYGENIVSANNGDANVTLTAWSVPIQIFSTTLTTNRTITLPTTNVANGLHFRIVRTGLGSFTLAVGSAKTFPSATGGWCDVVYNGTTWIETGFGTL